jgi:hypothetical protein
MASIVKHFLYRFYILIYISFLLFSCGNNKSKHSNESLNEINPNSSGKSSFDKNEGSEEKYPDGSYCAEVQYSNPNTGTHSTYTLTVEIESNEVTLINFPNGGHMDQDHFKGADLDDDGNTSFTNDRGYNYEIQIIGRGDDCLSGNVTSAEQCTGTTEDGDQCENMTDNSNGLCWQHQDQE